MIEDLSKEVFWEQEMVDWPPWLVERFNIEYERFCRERGLLTGAQLYKETNKQFYVQKQNEQNNKQDRRSF